MKQQIRQFFLWLLNSSWLNGTPAKYGFINGLEAVSYEELQNEVRQSPHKLIRDLVRDIDSMNSCPVYPHVHENGEIRPMNDNDIEDLQHLNG